MTELSELGIRLPNNSTGTHKVVCPQCSHTRKNKKDPCLSVTMKPDGDYVYFCHHCQFKGGTNGVARVYRRPDFKRQDRPQEGYSERMVDYFDQRGIGAKTLAENHVHYGNHYFPSKGKEVGCIAFPYLRNGDVINVKYRTVDKHFTQEADAEKIVYGLDDIDETCVIVEGELDKLTLWESGCTSAISVPDGAPAKPVEEGSAKFDWLRNCEAELSKVKKFILAVDNDEPGKVLEHELARRLGIDRCWRVTWPDGCKDANDVLKARGVEGVARCIAEARPYPVTGLYRSSEFADAIMDYYDNGLWRGASTGWSKMDRHYTVRPGELTIITAVPNSGKSEWIDALTVNLAMNYGWEIGICSFENPKQIHANKLAGKYFGMSTSPKDSPRVSREQMLGFISEGGWLDCHFHWLSAEEETPTFEWILEKAKSLVFRYGIKGFVIDPYNEIEHKRNGDEKETDYVSRILSQAKRFAQNYGVHIWFVAHPGKMRPNSDGETPVPSLYDISGSANWINKADVGIVINRVGETPMVEIYFKKVRFRDTGERGMVTLHYDTQTGMYSQ